MPGRLFKAAIIAYGVICIAFQARLSLDWLLRETTESQRVRRPFTIRNFDYEGAVDNIFSSATRNAGLQKGDRLLSIDGEPYTGAGSFYRALDTHKRGDRLRLVIRRPTDSREREIDVPLRSVADEGASWGPRDLVYIGITQILTPLMALGLGLLVLIRRPSAPLSWALFAFLVSFSVMAMGGLSYDPIRMVCQWEPGLRAWALGHMAFWFYLWPILLFVFSVYFPHRAEWHIARPWLLWLLVTPPLLHAILRAIAFPAGVEALPNFRELVRFADATLSPRAWAYFALGCIIATFIESARKLSVAADADTKRRLRILLAASAVAWTPFLLAVFAQDLFGIRARGWVEIAAISFLLVFPVTLVYLILVERAMDIGVTVREGLQYAVARRGLYVVQFLVVLGLVVGLATKLGEPGVSMPNRMRTIGLGIAAAMLSRRLVEKAGKWIDRRFFREQYQAGQLLTELAQQAGETADRTRLRDLVTSRIASTLHSSSVHLIDNGTSEFAGTLSRLSQERKPQRLDWRHPAEWLATLDPPESARLSGLHAELLLPVARQDRLLGFLALGPRRSEEPYSTSDVAVLQSVASQTALALDNARLAETIARESASREILSRELQIAREVQERLLPRTAAEIPGLDVAGLCVPAREVGGDLFDYVALPNGEWAIAVGDVAGKGVSASLIMASLQAYVRGLSADGIADLPELMARLNRLTYDSTPSNRFATFQIAVFDPASRRLRFGSAGHNPAIHLTADGTLNWLRPKGVALGLKREAGYEQMEVTFIPGDLLLLYTDGVTEAMNPAGELYGEERLVAWARSHPPIRPSLELARDLAAQVVGFAGAAAQHDDITIIAIR